MQVALIIRISYANGGDIYFEEGQMNAKKEYKLKVWHNLNSYYKKYILSDSQIEHSIASVYYLPTRYSYLSNKYSKI